MDQIEDRKLNEDMKQAGKKTYQKPTVQVYGTLTELTQAANNGHPQNDGGGGPRTSS